MNAYTPHTSARATDPHTSHQAAYAAASFAGTHAERILQVLKSHGAMDPEQLARHTDMEAYSVRKRLADLQKAGQAEPTGQTVPTASGRQQRIWRAV